MTEHLCYRCMKHMVKDGEVCPCGFDLQAYLEDTHHLIPGTMLRERYMLGAAIGEGGFGITYIGMDTLFNRKVAVKEFYIEGFVNRNNTVTANVSVKTGSSSTTFSSFKDKFLAEARTLAKFSEEEGIVSVIDYFEENNTAYIVMEYLDGQTLREYLKKEQVLSWNRTLQILTPVMKSLSKVHAAGIVHRDIAPDNIMLTTEGKVKLLDFGAARVVDSGDLHSRSMVLKQGYAPMEQYRSNGNLQGSWTDVYALCATIYVCITGILPEDGMERYIEDHLKPAHTLVNCPKELSDILMKGMAVKYKDRYQTVGELYEAFEEMNRRQKPKNVPDGEEATVLAGRIKEVRPEEKKAEVKKPEVKKAEVKAVPKKEVPVQQKETPVSKGVKAVPTVTCPNCGGQTDRSKAFCMQCGYQLIRPMQNTASMPIPPSSYCPNCGNPVTDGTAFCTSCGYQLIAPVRQSAPVQVAPAIPVPPQVNPQAAQVRVSPFSHEVSATGLTKASRFVAAACFGIVAVLFVQSYQGDIFEFWRALPVIGYGSIVVGMLMSKPGLAGFGAALHVLCAGRGLFSYYQVYKNIGMEDFMLGFPKHVLISSGLLFVYWMILVFASGNRKKARGRGISAGVIALLRFAVILFGNFAVSGSVNMSLITVEMILLQAVGAFMFGIASQYMQVKRLDRLFTGK